jgi:hypothetical protein
MWQDTAKLLARLLRPGRTPAGPQAAKTTSVVHMPAVVDEDVPPLIAIYYSNWGLGTRTRTPRLRVILAVWRDGRVVWSHDSLRGGRPYWAGAIVPQRLERLLDDLKMHGIFSDSSWDVCNVPPDYEFVTIAIADGTRHLQTISCHELLEDSPTVVATSYEIVFLAGRDRAEVLTAEPERYHRFLRAWGELRDRLSSLLPYEGADAGALRFGLRRLTIEAPR